MYLYVCLLTSSLLDSSGCSKRVIYLFLVLTTSTFILSILGSHLSIISGGLSCLCFIPVILCYFKQHPHLHVLLIKFLSSYSFSCYLTSLSFFWLKMMLFMFLRNSLFSTLKYFFFLPFVFSGTTCSIDAKIKFWKRASLSGPYFQNWWLLWKLSRFK